jgi:hypothetical protein
MPNNVLPVSTLTYTTYEQRTEPASEPRENWLFYKKFKKDLESIGFNINPYDPFVANRMIGCKEQMETWHVDDLKSSHINKKGNDDFLEWLQKMYGDEKIAPVKEIQGQVHEYLAMKLDYSENGVIKLNMMDYVNAMVNDFPEAIPKSNYPWNENVFKVDARSPALFKEKKKCFIRLL